MSETRPHDRLVSGLLSIGPLTPGERAALSTLPMRTQAVPAHRDVVLQGDRPTDCCLVLSGFLCRHKIVCGSQRQILSFHLPGDIPDLQSLHLESMDYSLGALVPSQVAFIPHAAVREAMAREPGINAILWRATLLDAAIFRAWLASVGRRPAYQRIAHLFCEIYVRMKMAGIADAHGFTLPVTQTELADALGLSAVHVNRTLQQLRQDGVIVSRGKYHGFTDWERLKQAGDFDPSYLYQREPT
jgi:CRP-like cAMP-binding protein